MSATTVPLKSSDIQQLIARMGTDKVLTSEADRIVYSTDVGSPPSLVNLLLLKKNKAEAIVRCEDTDDVASVVSFCHKRLIPMTPRASATNALGGAIPKRAGVVIDLTSMNRRIDIDEANMSVTVDAGVVIKDLRAKLNEVGLDLPVYPTSALAATIGGFVAMDGHGINATRHGNIGRHVTQVEGVDPSGDIFRIRDQERLEFMVGLGGSTGILTRITLNLVEATAETPIVLTCKNYRQLQAMNEELLKRFQPKHVMFHNNTFFQLRAEGAGDRKAAFAGKHAIIAAFDGTVPSEELGRLAKRHGGDLVEGAAAQAEWDGRFYPIRAKRMGPSLVAGEVYVPTDKLANYLNRLHDKVAVKELSIEGHVTDDGRIYFFIFTLDDERRPTYPLGWGTSAWILSLAKKMGGRSYQSGVWLQWESKSVYGNLRYKKLKAYKKQADNRMLMNPGTVFPMPAPVPEFVYRAKINGPVPAPSLGFQLWAGNPMLQRPGIASGGMARNYRRHKTIGVAAADVAADMARGQDLAMFSNDIWGCDLPSAQAIPNPGNLPMTQTVRGKMVLAKAFLQGKIVDPNDLAAALNVADPSAEEATLCLDYEHIQGALDAFRRTVQNEGVELEVKAVEIVEEVVEEVAADAGESKLDIEAIKKQAAATPEAEKAWVVAADCIVCNGCESACPTDAALVTDMARVDRDLCIADGACFDACPTGAIRPGEEDQGSSAGWPEGSRLAGKFGV